MYVAGVERGVLGVHLILCASRLVCDELVRLVQRLESAYVGHFAGNGVQVALVSVTGSRRALARSPRDVDLGDEVTAWGVFPGGPSGNPGSPFYDNTIEDWAKGNYYHLFFMKNIKETAL